MPKVIFKTCLMLVCIGCIQCANQTTTPSSQSPKENTQAPKAEKMQSTETPKYTELLNLDYILGKYNPAEHPSLIKIPNQYADKTDIYLHTEAMDAYAKMYDAAAIDGVKLVIRSATRNFAYQKSIWEAKWNGSRILSSGINAAKDISDPVARAKEIMKYSAMPGASRHHWGTDIDLNAFDNSYFESGSGKEVYDWLVNHAHDYGYYQVYTTKGQNRQSGYEEEKWHWTYKPVSKYLTAFASEQLQDTTFANFSGSDVAPQLNVVSDYVLGIHPGCH